MPKILLVEDDRDLAGLLMRFLNSEGYTVSYASGQSDGMRIFNENVFDCVLLDISLKDGSGYSVCAAIKAISDTQPERAPENRAVGRWFLKGSFFTRA